MAFDDITALLERAAGPDPGPGDETDVRRRARRYVRRRRAVVTGVAAALLVPGTFVAEALRPDRTQEITTSNPGGIERPAVPLFERRLDDGSLLRVTSGDDLGEVVVDWPGSPDAPVSLWLGGGSTVATVTSDEWTVIGLRPCPGDEANSVRAFQTDDPVRSDEMHLVDGLAVVVVRPLVSETEAPLPGTHQVTVQTEDAAGKQLSNITLTADIVGSDQAGPTGPTGPADDAGEDDGDRPPTHCEPGR